MMVQRMSSAMCARKGSGFPLSNSAKMCRISALFAAAPILVPFVRVFSDLNDGPADVLGHVRQKGFPVPLIELGKDVPHKCLVRCCTHTRALCESVFRSQ